MRALAVAVLLAAAFALLLPEQAPTTEGQTQTPPTFAFEVLSGVRQETRLSDGWHGGARPPGGWAEAWALDWVADYSLGKLIAWWLDPPKNTKPDGYAVHAVFRHSSGNHTLTAKTVSTSRLNCDGVRVDLYDGATRVAMIEYLHADPNPAIDFTIPHSWTLGTGGATTSSVSAFGTHLAKITPKEDKCPGHWTGAHLHQRVMVNNGQGVKAKRAGNLQNRGHADYQNSRVYLGAWGHWNRSWVKTSYLKPTTPGHAEIANTGGIGLANRNACREDARTNHASLAEGADVRVLAYGSGACMGWAEVTSPPGWLCTGTDRAYWNIWRGSEPTSWNPSRPTTICPSWTPPTPPTLTPTVRIEPGAGVTEGSDAMFTLTAEPNPTTAITVKLTVTQSGSYVASADQGAKSVEIPKDGMGTYKVPTVPDLVDEPDGSVTVTVGPGGGYEVAEAPGDAATVKVEDDDSPQPSYRVTVRKAGSGTGTVSPETGRYRGKQTFAATTTGGSTFGGWSGCDSVDGTKCTVTVMGARTITATFNPPPTYLVTVKKSGSGMGTVSPGGGQYRGSKTFTATPTGPSTFGGWSGCDSVTGASCSVNVTKARTITATFNLPPTYLVTVKKSGGGAGTVSPGGGQYRGSKTFTAIATGASTFGGWSGCDSVDETKCTVNVTKARTITATFNPPPTFLVTVKKSGSGAGTVSPGGGQYRGSKTFTATATGASTFGGWSGCDSVDETKCTVNVTSVRTITVAFNPPPTFLVTVKKSGSGTGTVSPSSGQYRGRHTFTATPTGRSAFGAWSGCDSVTGASCSVNVTAARTITATFKPPQCTVVAVASKGGMVSGGGTVDCGTAVPLRATAKAGYCFSYWNQLIAPGEFARATSSVCLTRGAFNVTTSSGTPNKIYQAVFRAKRSYTLTVVGGSGGGSYLEGTWARASAPAGKCFLGTAYIFKRWTGDSTSTSRVISVRMNRNKSVTATFTVAGTCPFAQAEEGEAAPHVVDDP